MHGCDDWITRVWQKCFDQTSVVPLPRCLGAVAYDWASDTLAMEKLVQVCRAAAVEWESGKGLQRSKGKVVAKGKGQRGGKGERLDKGQLQ